MPRYGFSNRWAVSPFSSQDGVPDVTSEDYSYITSADLEDHGIDIPRPYAAPSHIDDPYSHSAPSPTFGRQRPEDDVLLIRHQSVTYEEHFPAYSIGDGKLLVSDLRERVKMILDLSDRQARRVKLYYKGRRLKKADSPVREYGAKNNSEILLVPGESGRGSGSETSEEVVVVEADGRDRYETHGNSPRMDSPRMDSPRMDSPRVDSPRVGRSGRWDDRSPRGSGSQVGLGVPVDDNRRRGTSRVRTQSPGSAASAASAPAAAPVGMPGGPIEKLNGIAADFNNNWLPKCLEYIARTPRDSKQRNDEHRKLTESILQQTILKLDAIETSTEEGARARRKALVVEVQNVLSRLDTAKNLP
ncbi:BAG domain-containing protein [Parachaetomium inaequale]|uniref:BAG domain-containing protein n=1 Tax=Parachaetomium inaequale TaxID=2588326 RepID=A0AAN6SSB2_9PEZI|nr:BAG domain-containing protein [Parachaetomium inaequale]